MPTRRQDDKDRKFRQDAYSSSAENDRGCLGNLVAARCHRVTDADEISMIWWLQQVSWRDGGMEKFAADLIAANPGMIGSRTMLKIGAKPGQQYSAEQVRAIRAEIGYASEFPLRGEIEDGTWQFLINNDAQERRLREEAQLHPLTYPAKKFLDICRSEAEGLADFLKRSLVNPASPSLKEGTGYFPDLWNALNSVRRAEIEAAGERITETEIVRAISEELDFALQSRSFILIEGREGIGKSEAVKAWCGKHPGQAIYCRLESGNDEASLFRSIARAIGTACSLSFTAAQMRARIQDTLQAGHLMLVLDEAHFLWPVNDRTARCTPRRIEWLRTAIVDFGVPVALVSTPQFFSRQCDRFRKIGWNANQIQRRLVHTVSLPEVLSAEDTIAVARRYFPAASARDLKQVAGTALISLGFLSTISNIRKRVDFLAAKSPQRERGEVLQEALAAYKTPVTPAESAPSKAPAGRLQGSESRPAAPSIPTGIEQRSKSSIVQPSEPALTVV